MSFLIWWLSSSPRMQFYTPIAEQIYWIDGRSLIATAMENCTYPQDSLILQMVQVLSNSTPTQGSHLHRFQNVALNLVVPAYSVWSPPKLKLSYFCTSRVFLSGEPPPVTCTLQKWKVSIARRWTQEENNCLPLWRVTSCCCKKGGISLPKTERRRWFWIAEEWVI